MVYNYPKQIKAFYMRVNEDDKTVAAVDILFPEVFFIFSKFKKFLLKNQIKIGWRSHGRLSKRRKIRSFGSKNQRF